MHVEFTQQEGEALMTLMDAGVKHDDLGGLRVSAAATIWSQKLIQAQKEGEQAKALEKQSEAGAGPALEAV